MSCVSAVQKLLTTAGAKDVNVDFDAKTATFKVPAGTDAETMAAAVGKTDRFSATVHQ